MRDDQNKGHEETERPCGETYIIVTQSWTTEEAALGGGDISQGGPSVPRIDGGAQRKLERIKGMKHFPASRTMLDATKHGDYQQPGGLDAPALCSQTIPTAVTPPHILSLSPAGASNTTSPIILRPAAVHQSNFTETNPDESCRFPPKVTSRGRDRNPGQLGLCWPGMQLYATQEAERHSTGHDRTQYPDPFELSESPIYIPYIHVSLEGNALAQPNLLDLDALFDVGPTATSFLNSPSPAT